jgi:hypothetical protein
VKALTMLLKLILERGIFMKKMKLYNVIFPIWLLLFFPPVIFITLIGNFVIDSIVVIVCCRIFKLINSHNILYYWKKSIFKVWLIGFLADFIGALFLFSVQILGDSIGMPYNITNSIAYNPFNNIWGCIIVVIAISISAVVIYIMNARFAFKNIIEDEKMKVKFAITLAIVTAPWTFLLPTQIFY